MSTKSTQKKIQTPLFRFFDTKDKVSRESNNENQRIADCVEPSVDFNEKELNVPEDQDPIPEALFHKNNNNENQRIVDCVEPSVDSNEKELNVPEDQDPIPEALSTKKVVNQKSSKKHYKLKFNKDWIDKTNEEFRDWIQPTNDSEKFFDMACNEEYQCEYLHKHELKDIHKDNYKKWKKSIVANKTLTESINFGNSILAIQSKVVLFLVEHNAPLSWTSDLAKLLKSCCPEKKGLNHLDLYQQKASWIAQGLAQSVKDTIYQDLKATPYSLHFDETSTNRYKYGAFLARRVAQDFGSVESILIDIYSMVNSNADSAFNLYNEYIVKQNIESLLTGICLDNCNVMRGQHNSFTTRIQRRKSRAAFPPCILHVLNICEKTAFSFIPDVSFYKNVYSYFSSSIKRTDEFNKIQKMLGIETTLITQPAHTRWLTWSLTVSRINKKWGAALIEYFKKPRLTNNSAKLSLLAIPVENSTNTEVYEEHNVKEVEKKSL